MNKKLKSSLNQALLHAKLSCNPALRQEEGGFILLNLKFKKFEFIKIQNANTGPIAAGLYTADRAEYGEKVLTKVLTGNYEEYASFHSHPPGYGPYPSRIDLEQLFTGFPVNYIYAPDLEVIVEYTFDIKNKVWIQKLVK